MTFSTASTDPVHVTLTCQKGNVKKLMCQLHIKKLVTQISSFIIHLTIYTYHSSQQSVNKKIIPRGITKKPYLEFEFRKLVW